MFSNFASSKKNIHIGQMKRKVAIYLKNILKYAG